MEKVKNWMRTVMYNHYLETEKILSFQQIQDILIDKGFSYYVNKKDGKKKLRIRKALRPSYLYIKKILPQMKKRRELGFEVLTKLLNEREFGLYKETFKVFEPYLTKKDKEYLRRLKESKREKTEVLKL